MTSLLKKLTHHNSENDSPMEDLEETKPMVVEGETTRNTPAKRPPAIVAEAWQEHRALERRFAEEEKEEAKAIAALEKQAKEYQKAEKKAGKALEKAESEVVKAPKRIEKDESGTAKHQEATEEHAEAIAKVEAKRQEHQQADQEARAVTDRLDRAMAEQITKDRDRKAELEASVPKDKFTRKRNELYRIPIACPGFQ